MNLEGDLKYELTDKQKQEIEGLLQYSEVKNMKNDKSPGGDDFTSTFIKFIKFSGIR